MRWVSVILILIIPSTVSAEINKRNVWISLGLLPVAFFHETTLHEAAHVAVAKATIPNMELTRFAPYPCYDRAGDFHFGHFTMLYPNATHISNNTHIAIDLAPYVLGTSTFIVSDLLLSTKVVDPKKAGGAVLYMLGMFAPFVDFAMNFIFNKGDWHDIRERSRGVTLDVVGGVLLAVGTYRLVKQGYAVFRR